MSGLSRVTSFSLTLGLPIDHSDTWVIAREAFPAGRHWWVSEGDVSREYFQTLGISLTRGRGFERADTGDSPPVAIVSETLARWLWPGQNPVGQSLSRHWPDSTFAPTWLEVVGVVKDVAAPLSPGPTPAVYLPLLQQKSPYARTIVAQGHGAPGDLIRDLRNAVFDVEPDIEVSRSSTMTAAIAALLYPRRMAAGILALSGVLGLLLASLGICGVVSYSVAQRLREIGIRMSLGAERRGIIGLVMMEGLTVTLIGSAAGFGLAVLALRVVSSKLTAVPAFDVFAFASVPIVLAVVILAACYLPARRAARVDPLVVLRNL